MAETTHTEWRRDQLSWTAESFHCLLFNSSALYYLQTPTRRYGHASTPPQFLPISGDRDVSPPPYLEWHVWSSSSWITVLQFTGHSLPVRHSVAARWDLHLVPYYQPSSPARFLSITGHWDVSLPFGASLWNGMFGRVDGQNTTGFPTDNCSLFDSISKWKPSFSYEGQTFYLFITLIPDCGPNKYTHKIW